MTGNKLKYRLVADVEGLEMPVKLNSPVRWITVTMDWTTIRLKKRELLKPFFG